MPKVSIIIPFNNVEDYIKQCLDSVLSQTLKDIEIILVNDASTDKSRKIVQKYADKDKRIKIIDLEERKGQGFARNRAIEVATGEYIGFVDSDDFIETNMFEELYEKAKSDDTDITMCQVREYDDINEYYISSDYYSLEPLISLGEKVFSAEETKEQILDINVALWNKIYKREYLNKIGEKFPEGFIYEDLPFFFGTYLPAKRINIVWKNLYSYRVNRKNSTMQQFNDKILDRLPMVSLTYEKIKSVDYLDNLKQRIQGWIINDLFHRYTLLKENYHKEYFFLMKKVFENLEIENVEDDYWQKVYHFEGYLLVMNNSFEDFNQKVFNEYLDIHKLEDRLQSQIISIDEIDRRFGLIYDDLSKVYKYSEDIVNEAKNQIKQDLNIDEKINVFKSDFRVDFNRNLEEKSNKIISETDEKISKVYGEITKNYEYTNQLKEELVSNIQQATSSVDDKIQTAEYKTDVKISKVYEDITKNYEYTNKLSDELKTEIKEKSKELYNDIKDLSFVVHDNFVELNKEQDKVVQECKFVIDAISKHEKYINEQIESLNTKLNNVSSVLEKEKEQRKDLNLEFIKRIENEKSKTEKIVSDLKAEFLSILSEREEQHRIEVEDLKTQIRSFESTLREEMKSPLKKFVEKYQNKQVK
ncbi:MAG: glycosyltransferase [Candidatus Gastranaerophilales bacterium]|nr:glycosyltransferase [Candidatus Gastranaerophilales bacterium]